ncbi:hypothetical protein GALMADRAFT_212070 [Galerina marginata CBS 339.88]|uniref:Uncharacterized protein n=1 Tax=Galerina marginata (strain CBS 339.88) TaxID=685588 RepID=A0A067SUK6_GALM3|nr:hypothetical protein GALMADRAFT_212070 [Galerina marginata CBS 339.88]
MKPKGGRTGGLKFDGVVITRRTPPSVHRKASDGDEDTDDTSSDEKDDDDVDEETERSDGRMDDDDDDEHRDGVYDPIKSGHTDDESDSPGQRRGDDIFMAPPSCPLSALSQLLVHGQTFKTGPPRRNHRKSTPPIESGTSGSDFEELRHQGKVTRAFRDRREDLSETSDSDDAGLADDVVESGPSRHVHSKIDKGKQKVIASDVDNCSGLTNDEDHQSDDSTVDEEGPKGDIKAGRISLAFTAGARKLGEDFAKLVAKYAKANRMTEEKVLQLANFANPLMRAVNFWNKFQQWRARNATDAEVEGYDCQAFREKVEKDLEELASDETATLNPARRLLAAERQIQAVLAGVNRLNKDFLAFGAIVHVGTNAVARQNSGVIAGSEAGEKLIKDHKFHVQSLIDTIADKYRSGLVDARLKAMLTKKKPVENKDTVSEKADSPAEADSKTKPQYRQEFATEVRKQINSAAPELATRKTVPWGNLTERAVTYCFHIVGWPDLIVPAYPHQGLFDPAKQTLQAWKPLVNMLEIGSLRVVPWTKEEKKIPVGSVAYFKIPLLISTEDKVLIMVQDVKQASVNTGKSVSISAPNAKAKSMTAPAALSAPLRLKSAKLTNPVAVPPDRTLLMSSAINHSSPSRNTSSVKNSHIAEYQKQIRHLEAQIAAAGRSASHDGSFTGYEVKGPENVPGKLVQNSIK